ncbi:dual specificity protein phosphatase 18 [Drosophila grimshawi]|uniref:GH18398 n=1 Tax=Drosophila grimshawi TaxID=7222 RepID=B4JES1_DROGR|nr:dual specificity protein phosphatase 18 [Drosophila grimshawi]EDV93202.1 GH18398 [Drosophila grimshawi]
MQELITIPNLPAGTQKKLRSIVDDINNISQSVLAETNDTNRKDLECQIQTKLEDHTPYPGISRLTPSLYLCGAAAVVPAHLDKLGVSCVVNVAPELPDTPLSSVTNPLYLRINAQDRAGVNLAAHFEEVADLIEEVRLSGGCSLVHCVAGVSRSASLCLAYLIKYGGMSLREAYTHVQSRRPQVRPNSGFFQQLRQYEQDLRGSCSVEMIYFASLDKEIPDILEPEYRAMEDFYQRYRTSLKKR